MKLQIAVDIADTKEVMQIASEIHDVIDIFEVGTPVIMKEGLSPVKALKEKYPDLCVLADTKIMDGGSIECGDACEAGADIVTVLAVSDNATIREVCETAHKYHRKVMADLICIEDIEARAKKLLKIGVDLIGIHTGVDMQKEGRSPLKELSLLSSKIESSLITVAGGIKINTVDEYIAFHPGVVIAGGALCNAENIRQAVLEMKGRFNHGN